MNLNNQSPQIIRFFFLIFYPLFEEEANNQGKQAELMVLQFNLFHLVLENYNSCSG